MVSSALWWLFFNLITIVLLGFYSMMEMACVSFNKVRLHYYVHIGDKRAIWLNYLLTHPFRLFGTTLIGVNVAMVAGSECAREFHSSIGLNPDLAPLSQVVLVVVFGELAPMFAARHYAENVAMLGSPLLYFSAKLMTPMIWLIGKLTKFINFLFIGKEGKTEFFLSQEELQTILEEHSEEHVLSSTTEELNVIAANIFRLRHQVLDQIHTPLTKVPKLPVDATIAQVRNLMGKTSVNYIPIYHNSTHNIIGIAYPRDLIRIPDSESVKNHTRPPWFVTQTASVTEILHQFRKNNQSVAVILDLEGKASGLIDLDDVLEQLFGKIPFTPLGEKPQFVIERTFPGDMTVSEFNKLFDVKLDDQEMITLSELMTKTLGQAPEKGDSIYIEPFELSAIEVTILEVKTISVKTRKR